MTNEEIYETIENRKQKIRDILSNSNNFELNTDIVRYRKEINELRKQCTHINSNFDNCCCQDNNELIENDSSKISLIKLQSEEDKHEELNTQTEINFFGCDMDEDYNKNNVSFTLEDEKQDIELWNELKSAIRSGIYYSAEIFPTLSKELQIYLKNPMQLKELAMSNADDLETVQKGIFLKQMPIIKQREKEKIMMLPERREMLEKLAEKMGVKGLMGE